ncbi:hypothetical protein ACVOMV_17175 [Mesorhizobium atlanticum]
MSFLAGCSGGVLDPQGPIGAGNRTILLNSLAVMLVIVIPTLVALLAIAWMFRATNRSARYDPEFTYSGRIELIVWSIPTLTVLFLGGLIYYGSYHLDPRRPIERPASGPSRSKWWRSTGSGCFSIRTKVSERSTSWSFPLACRCISG